MSRTNHARGNARPDIRTLDAKPVLDAAAHIAQDRNMDEMTVLYERGIALAATFPFTDEPNYTLVGTNEPIDFDALAEWEIELLGRADSAYATEKAAHDAVNGLTTVSSPRTTRKAPTMRTKTTIEFVGMNAATLAQILVERNRNRQATCSRRDIEDARRNKAGMRHAYVATT